MTETGFGFGLQDGDWTRVRQLFQIIGSSLRLGPTSTPRFAGLTSEGDLMPATDSAYDIGETTTPLRWKNIECAGTGRFDGGIAVGTAPGPRLIKMYASSNLGVGLDIDNLGTGDTVIKFAFSSVAKFILGVDNSDSDKFKIAVGGGLGTNTALTIDSSGNFDFGSGNFANVGTIACGAITGGTYNGLTISTAGNWSYLTGAGAIGNGLDIAIPNASGNDFFYGEGGTEHHKFGNSSQVEISDDGIITALQYNGITLAVNDLVIDDFANGNSLTVSGDWTIDQSVAIGAAPTFNNLKIEGGIPILIFKDTTDTGDDARGFEEWRDSNNVRLGFFGNYSYTNDDLMWKNESSGGHLLLETTGAGIVSSNTGFATTGSGRFDGGLKTGATYILTVDETKSLSDYLLTDGSRALAGAWDMGSQALTNVNIDTGDIATAVTNSEWDAAYTHISNDGTDHSLLGATPGTVSASLAVIVDASKDIDFVDGDIKTTGIFEGTTFQGYGDADTKIEFLVADGFYFQAGNIEFMRITEGARADDLELNSAGLDINTTIKGDNNALLFRVDAGLDVVRIGDGGTTNYAEFSTTGDLTLFGSATLGLTQKAGTTTDGDLWNDSTQKALQTFVSGIEQTLEGVIFTQTADQTIANTTTETTLFGTGVGTLTLPANFWVVGKTIRIEIHGDFADTGNPTAEIQAYYGATSLIDSGAITLSGLGGTEEWETEVVITCRSVGATGTVETVIDWEYETTTGSSPIERLDVAGALQTIDTTAPGALDVTFQWGTAAAANTLHSHVGFVEVLN